MYYYLNNVGMYVYEDKIEVPKADITKIKRLIYSLSQAYPSEVTPDRIGSSSFILPLSSDNLLLLELKLILMGSLEKN